MSRDDPFGLSEDRERTRIRMVGAPINRPVAPMPSSAPIKRSRAHPNPLVSAFAPLLEFAPELEHAVAPDNPEALRTRLFDALIKARDQVVANGGSLANADAAAWAVAALLDDLALNTPWGGASAWPRQPLVVMLRGDVDAGAQFFSRLEELERHPTRDPHLLELMYHCLALGFRGKFRIPGRSGDRTINAVRAATARFLRQPDDEDSPLSPRWRGVDASDEPKRFAIPIWVMAALAAVIVTAVHVAFSIQLSTQSAELATLVRALPPPDRAAVERTIVREAPSEAPPIEPVQIELLPEFQAAAPPDLLRALKGRESVSLATLVIQKTNPKVFESARSTLTEGFEPLIGSIAGVIVEYDELIGNITVLGHTDSIPLQRSNPLSNNQRLSEARAETVADLLAQNGVPRERIRVEGRASADPVADDGTREGRALNRRVEVLIEKRL